MFDNLLTHFCTSNNLAESNCFTCITYREATGDDFYNKLFQFHGLSEVYTANSNKTALASVLVPVPVPVRA